MSVYIDRAIEIAREAGALLKDYFDRRVGFELKGTADLVTEADRASEKLVVERLRKEFPDHGIVGEEGANYPSTSGYQWYVDPLDGTTNFAHGFPIFNITLGLEKDGELIAGVIFDPTRPELFAAERGSGAFCNGARIHVSKVPELRSSLVATGFPPRTLGTNRNIHFYHEIGMLSHGVRRSGSAAIDLAYVACGRIEAFWENGLNPWDQAAGIVLIEEAGGRTSDMKGGKTQARIPHLAATNGLIHDELLAAFSELFAGRVRHPMPSLS